MYINKKNTSNIIIIFSIFLIYILLLNSKVGIYFDDYAYLTLSYPYSVDGISGNTWSFMQLIEFLKMHYDSWGGRVLYFGIELFLHKIGGVTLMRMAQAIIIFLTIFIIYKIINEKANNNILSAIIACSMYGFLLAAVTKEAIYWFAASTSYIWPMLPFMLYILLNIKADTVIHRKRKVIMCLVGFLAAFSQEQIGFAVIVYSLLIILYTLFEVHKIRSYQVANLCFSLLGFWVLYMAPGNFARKSKDEFYNSGIFNILRTSTKNMLYGLFGEDNWLFAILVMIISAYLLTRIKKRLKNNVNVILHIIIEYILYLSAISIFMSKGRILSDIYEYSTRVFNIMGIIALIVIVYSHIRYFITNEFKNEIIIMLTAISTIAPGLYAPYWVNRMMMPFAFMYFAIAGIVICDILKKENMQESEIYEIRAYKVIIIILLVCSIINLGTVLNGYTQEGIINSYNQEILEETARENKTDTTIVLKKNLNCKYFALMPWIKAIGDSGKGMIESNMKRYYGIDNSVEFKWKR